MAVKNKDKKGEWGSHLPILSMLMHATESPENYVLELGTGIYSTMLFDLMCKDTGRKVVSVDSDPAWHEPNKARWESDYHKMILIDDEGWDNLPLVDPEGERWSIVFIDHKPAKRRHKDAARYAQYADFVVIHDSEPTSDKFFKYSWIYKYFKYRLDYKSCVPNTTILSNFYDPKVFLKEAINFE